MSDIEARARFLGRLKLATGFHSEDHTTLAEALNPRSYGDGEVMIEEGEDTDGMFLLTKGSAKVVREPDGGGEEVELARMGAPTILGEIGLLTGGLATATVKADGQVETLMLSHDAFADLLREGGHMVSRMILNISRVLAGRLDATNATVVTLMGDQSEKLEAFQAATRRLHEDWSAEASG